MATEFAQIIEPLAKSLLGEPNSAMSSPGELRYGARGSLSVDLAKGTWFDHEMGEGGGALDLVTRELKLTGQDRLDWLKQHGFVFDTIQPGAPYRASIVATYDYVDEGGTLQTQVCRFDPKDFRQRRPDGNGGWIWSVKGLRHVPYRLPQLLENDDRVICIVEGEKDVDRLWQLGVPATCNAGGAGKWREELNQFFRGVDVVIIPDLDPQKRHPKTGEPMFHPDGRPILPGQDHAQAIAASLHDTAARVRVLELWQSWSDMPSKGDISDWIANGGTAEQLYLLIEKLPDWSQKKEVNRSDLLASAWLSRNLPARDYLLDGVLSTTSRWWIFGKTGIGKTLFALELAYAIAAGCSFLNWKGVMPRRVMYLDGEMPAETMKERIETAAEIYGGDATFWAYNRDVLSPQDMPPLNTPAGQQWLWAEIKRVGPELIVFDSIMCLLIGNLKEEETFKPCLPLVRQLSAQRIGQIWANHTGKVGESSFGDSSKEWEFDLIMKLGQEENSEAVVMEITKARLRTPGNTGLFSPQVIKRGDDGWTGEKTEKVGKAPSSQVQKLIWLRQVYWDLVNEVPVSAGYNGAPVRKVAVSEAKKRMIARGFLALEDGKIPSGERVAFHRARERLISSGEFAGDEGWIWAVKERG